MSDDLSAFFAKKKDKKKKTVVKMDEVGQILERKAKRQEEHDQQAADLDKRDIDEPKRANNGEESEWIEYGESAQGRLEGLKIKDMGAESEHIEEEEHESEDQKEQQEAVRTWGQVDVKKQEEGEIETATDMANYQKQNARPDIFVPSCLRSGGGGGYERSHRADIDVSNQEMFPSLADATKIEKDKKEDKTGGGWIKTGSSDTRSLPRMTGAPASASRDREQALAAAKAFAAANDFSNARSAAPTASIARPVAPAPTISRPVPAPTSSSTSSSSNAAEPPKYIPPHLRS
ncbi:unnamed protein product [Auanema sp. JU1783]|nr:unnamed protein product [Auanema sp. JU1783]